MNKFHIAFIVNLIKTVYSEINYKSFQDVI